ncbi:MAG: prepilin-type N-terminal cleavage/methylation domain-containing protein [Sedimentisphaerales bacterium]|nr:prepilin-type N-terminal cleavage/methylation domain-containing protein [Sedimentisphaerales bacterium]
MICSRRKISWGRSAKGVSLIEMLVALTLVALVLATTAALLHHITQYSGDFQERLQREAEIQTCMNRIVNEIAEIGLAGRVEIEHESQGYQVMSKLSIIFAADELGNNVSRQIDWIAVPRYEEQDLVLFRRETSADDRDTQYIPLCDNLHMFYAELVNGEGFVPEDPNEPTPIVEITAQVYQFGPEYPDNLLTYRRTYCLRRF